MVVNTDVNTNQWFDRFETRSILQWLHLCECTIRSNAFGRKKKKRSQKIIWFWVDFQAIKYTGDLDDENFNIRAKSMRIEYLLTISVTFMPTSLPLKTKSMSILRVVYNYQNTLYFRFVCFLVHSTFVSYAFPLKILHMFVLVDEDRKLQTKAEKCVHCTFSWKQSKRWKPEI